jgi:putative Holliday junction resolvase
MGRGRLLGIDLGERRIGLAVAEPDGRVRPLATLARRASIEADAATLGAVVRQEGVAELVVGLPLDATGGEGEQARRTRAWAEAVAARLGLPLAFRDERWTTEAAVVRAPRLPRGRSGGPPSPARRAAYRARLDREAAALILEAELAARREVR